MNINTFDILLLFILAITVSLIIGFNVMFIVNKKLSDIKINIPACPKPNIYIKSENGYLSKIEVDNVKRNNDKKTVENFDNNYKKQIIETFKPSVNNTVNNVKQKEYVSNVDMDKYNNYSTGYITADGRILNQNVSVFMPKVYMGTDPYGGRGLSYAKQSIETQADIDQIGSIPVNNYKGAPKAIPSL
jgi:hypothetical protein